MRPYTLGFDVLCIVLASYMTWKQVYTYFENDDFSEISFKRFEDGSAYNYPTFTICLEDNNLQQIYRTSHVKTKQCCPEDALSISAICPHGCRARKDNNKLILLNKTIKEICPLHNEPRHSLNFDSHLPIDCDYPPMLDNSEANTYEVNDQSLTIDSLGLSPPLTLDNGDISSTIANENFLANDYLAPSLPPPFNADVFKGQFRDGLEGERDENSAELFRKRRFAPYDDYHPYKKDEDFDLASWQGHPGEDVIVIQKDNKSFVIAAEHYH